MAEAAASSSSSSIPPSSTDHQNHYTYEVFLSFGGKDTRYNFTDHLYTALRQRGIKTFRDDDELRKGEEISAALLRAIEESRVSVIVFSESYAASSWCLDELVKIMECRESKRQEVRAVFYKVDPSHVRHQIGAFGDAFAKLDEGRHKDSMAKWRKALKETANLSGWTFKDGEYEANFIKTIIEELSAQVINPSCLSEVAAHPIGLQSCTQDLNELLRVEENNVRMIGIWGCGGIGKTTIAKAVFNSISHKYESSCFLADVRSNSLAQLQERLLFDVLKDSTLKVNDVSQGVSFIKTKMRCKKVLLILDDVSHSRQLQNLVPPPDCFGEGSRVLITTRDKRWLNLIDEVYEVKLLNNRQALELFSWNAFKSNQPPDDYIELAHRAVHYAQGLPLALTVLGSHLGYCGCKDEWEATLNSCKGEEPHREIRSILKISYEALEEDLKGYFLDIACFFKGDDVDDVKPILEACYNLKPATVGITQLQQKALIRIEDGSGEIWMHDLIEEMGKEIVHQESPDEPGGRSRLWCKDDVDHILRNNTGTSNIKGIQVPTILEKDWDKAKSLSMMKKLKYLSIDIDKWDCGESEFDYLFEELRYLDLSFCHSFPSGFHANKLVQLNFTECNLTNFTPLWDGGKKFPTLTSLKILECSSLIELPDFSGIPNLKMLDLYECHSLIEVPDSVGLLDKLVTLRVWYCSNLIRFPRIINLKSVETISIKGCPRLKEFSEVGEEMCSLRSLDLKRTSIKELHPSIGKLLIGLEELSLVNCPNLTSLPDIELGNLKYLNLNELSRRNRFLPNCFGPSYPRQLAMSPKFPVQMNSLRQLDLTESDIRELDESIGNLIGLQELVLGKCRNLTSLPCSIYGLQHLKKLYLSFCRKLVRFPTNTNIVNADGCSLSLPRLQVLCLRGCTSLSDCDFLMTLDCCQTLEKLHLSDCNRFVSLPACITKFVNLSTLEFMGCNLLRDLPELPPNVKLDPHSLKIFTEAKNKITEAKNKKVKDILEIPKAMIDPSHPTPLHWISLSMEPLVNPPKRQRTAGEASVVHFAHEMAISPLPMLPDLHSFHHSTATPQLQHQEEPIEMLRLSLSSEPTKPHASVEGHEDPWLSLS